MNLREIGWRPDTSRQESANTIPLPNDTICEPRVSSNRVCFPLTEDAAALASAVVSSLDPFTLGL